MLDRPLDLRARPLLQRAAAIAALVGATLALSVPSAASAGTAPVAGSAATASGSLTALVGGNGKVARALAARSVKLRAVKPATKRGARLAFPVASVSVEGSATVRLRGGVRFKAGRRAVTLRALRAKLTARKATIGARVGKRRLAVLVARYARGDARLNAVGDAAALESATLRLTPRGAQLLRKKLRLRDFPSGPLGAVSLDAVAGGVVGGPGGGGGGAGGGPGGSAPATCNPNPGAAPADPASEPAALTPPEGALGIASATIVWRPKESWIRYINGGEGTCVFDGATDGPREVRAGSSAPLVYSFGFPFVRGWFHAGALPAESDDTAAVYFSGGVGFKWKSHGINFSTADPEIEINGDASRGIFRFNGADGTPYPNRRGVLVDLDRVADSDPGPGYTFTMPATIPAGVGSSVFAGFYTAGTEFGTVTVSFTTQ